MVLPPSRQDRLMREHDLLAPSRVGAPRGPRSHDGTIIPGAVDVMWGTDLTTTWTGEGQAAVFVALDHCSAECVGLRHDHGPQYVSHDFQREVAFLGIESSPAFVRAPEGNGCAERFIRTLKESLLWARAFDTVEDLRRALAEFRETYNTTWLIGRHAFRPPAAVRTEQLQPAALAA